MRSFVLAGLLCGAVALAQNASPSGNQAPSNQDSSSAKVAAAKPATPSSPAKVEAVKAKVNTKSESVKAESVTINMPEGMTRDQADAILNELKSIHQLLQNQPATRAAAAAPAAPAPNEKVKMSVGTGW